MKLILFLFVGILCFTSCEKKKESIVTPWGTTINSDGSSDASDTSSVSGSSSFSLDDIVANGELIVLTLSGPDTYYEYHGHGMGVQYKLCERFASHIGVSLRVELCKDSAEMLRRLDNGDGDVIAYPVNRDKACKDKRLLLCGAETKTGQWVVASDNSGLAQALDQWFKPGMVAQVEQEEKFQLSTRSIRRHVFSPMLDKGKGIISKYDNYFKMYAGAARMDWRLMAAQCYQESCFDPNAKSWAGACGLMQIMPSTADMIGLPRNMLFEPEANISAAAKFLQDLNGKFGDIPDPAQRLMFVLASYNGGYFHIRDAQRLAKKYGRNPNSWGEVSEYVLKLRQPAFYNDPVVKYGYMRGDETSDYVARIRQRYLQYCGVASTANFTGGFGSGAVPTKAKHKNRFKL